MPDLPVLAIFGSSFLVGLSGAVSPGPLLAFNIQETMRRGFMAGPYVATGHAVLELLVVAALALGLSRVLDSDPVIAAVGVLGGLFLLWMGWRMLRDPAHGAPGLTGPRHDTSQLSVTGPIVGGILVSLSNPFWTVWWLTVGAAFITRSLELGLLGIGAFYLGHILSDYAWYSLVSGALASGRRLMTERVYSGIMLTSGAFLALMGVYFVITGVNLLV
jgi:threonine/homoserine/homoserine lactone efflux protein